jgi:hypothetical protein
VVSKIRMFLDIAFPFVLFFYYIFHGLYPIINDIH